MGEVINILTERNTAVSAATVITQCIKDEIAETGRFSCDPKYRLIGAGIRISPMEVSVLRGCMKDHAANLTDKDLEVLFRNFWWEIIERCGGLHVDDDEWNARCEAMCADTALDDNQ